MFIYLNWTHIVFDENWSYDILWTAEMWRSLGSSGRDPFQYHSPSNTNHNLRSWNGVPFFFICNCISLLFLYFFSALKKKKKNCFHISFLILSLSLVLLYLDWTIEKKNLMVKINMNVQKLKKKVVLKSLATCPNCFNCSRLIKVWRDVMRNWLPNKDWQW